MECKYGITMKFQTLIDELIDTLWNVNYVIDGKSFAILSELIDTLWNVNHLSLVIELRRIRINRYIMECKSISIGKCPERFL